MPIILDRPQIGQKNPRTGKYPVYLHWRTYDTNLIKGMKIEFSADEDFMPVSSTLVVHYRDPWRPRNNSLTRQFDAFIEIPSDSTRWVRVKADGINLYSNIFLFHTAKAFAVEEVMSAAAAAVKTARSPKPANKPAGPKPATVKNADGTSWVWQKNPKDGYNQFGTEKERNLYVWVAVLSDPSKPAGDEQSWTDLPAGQTPGSSDWAAGTAVTDAMMAAMARNPNILPTELTPLIEQAQRLSQLATQKKISVSVATAAINDGFDRATRYSPPRETQRPSIANDVPAHIRIIPPNTGTGGLLMNLAIGPNGRSWADINVTGDYIDGAVPWYVEREWYLNQIGMTVDPNTGAAVPIQKVQATGPIPVGPNGRTQAQIFEDARAGGTYLSDAERSWYLEQIGKTVPLDSIPVTPGTGAIYTRTPNGSQAVVYPTGDATFIPSVEQWRPALEASPFGSEGLVNVMLWVIQQESNGNPGAVGYGSIPGVVTYYGLFQSNTAAVGSTPQEQINNAWYGKYANTNTTSAQRKRGGAGVGLGHWGYNNPGVFGALSHLPSQLAPR